MIKSQIRKRLSAFACDERGGVTVEYVIIFIPMISLIFFIFEFAVGYHFTLSANKATAVGARMAAVIPPVNCGALLNSYGERIYELNTTAFNAVPDTTSERHCLNDPSPCKTFDTDEWSCTGASTDPNCNTSAMTDIYTTMSGLAGGLDPAELTISYTDSRFGYVNGSAIPLITVSILANRFEVNKILTGEVSVTLPAVSTTIIGEGLGAGKTDSFACPAGTVVNTG